MTNSQQLEQAISVLQAHRAILGDGVVQAGLAALRKQLAELEQQQASHTNLAGERKQVTVMFADISGFTAMSEKMDPEEVRSLINACFERLGAVIARYDGHIDKFIGDEIMALFGAPLTHENDPERSLRAALDMLTALAEFNTEHATRLPRPLALHFGINSGLVIAGGIGTRQRQDYSVMGDAVNLASRLEGLSQAGEILVGEDTYRLTAPRFEFENLPPVKVKGKEKPVKVYRLTGTKSTPDHMRGIEGLASPLVGRHQEMKLLREAMSQLVAGQGSIVSIMGEAGIGKSRLTRELYLECRQRPEADHITWARGRGLSYGENVSYLVARDFFCNLLEIEPDNKSVAANLALQSELDRLFPGHTAEIYPYLAHLLDLPLDEDAARRLNDLAREALHRRILQSAQRYLAAKAKDRPLVVVWEDLHWADPSSLELLEMLLPLTRENPLLLLLIYRPRRESRVWAFHRQVSRQLPSGHTCIELSPLTITESDRLLRNLLGRCDIPEKSSRLLLTKAEGNPFYIEEVIRSLIDQGAIVRAEDGRGWTVTTGIDDIQLPDTLQGIIMARIDRLPPEQKRLLQVASVIGRNFSYKVLAEVLGAE